MFSSASTLPAAPFRAKEFCSCNVEDFGMTRNDVLDVVKIRLLCAFCGIYRLLERRTLKLLPSMLMAKTMLEIMQAKIKIHNVGVTFNNIF